ncbi:Sec-independent protein translocase TatB [Frigoribacterium faeni]|uniref:Sec-independent protein translocase TatB n=1 Tax=Frigoribacterium faeni TaxID=145483 RepID=UPI001FADF6D8|nr:Sec-independent protein translocase TatB [Frigoribacterium faeni]MCJ0700857.1 Sec-independent protein translocase TatB [Frigoribacterium faeni]
MSLSGLTFDKLLIVGVLAVFLLGPDRLPVYASKLAQLVKSVKNMANGAKERMRSEMGPEFDEVEWQKLDPRQYAPRRIIRDALLDPPSGGATSVTPAAMATAGAVAAGLPSRGPAPRSVPLAAGEVAPYDSEAT